MREPCPIQEDCKWFTTGDNKPPNHHVRKYDACILFKGKCIEQHDIKQGDACLISKRSRLLKKLKGDSED